MCVAWETGYMDSIGRSIDVICGLWYCTVLYGANGVTGVLKTSFQDMGRAVRLAAVWALWMGAGVGVGGQALAPTVIPDPPTPFFSWDTIPTAFHGANRSGVYTDTAVELLARHQVNPPHTLRLFSFARTAYTAHMGCCCWGFSAGS
jgi:hypothetical protein